MHTSVFVTGIDERNICRTTVKRNAVIGLADAQENSKAVLKISQGKTLGLLVDLREIRSISKEARDHFAMHNRQPGVSAIAMLIKSPLSRVVGNFFLGINMPSVPTNLFTSEEKAIAWLKKF